jgi:hypothetical protein
MKNYWKGITSSVPNLFISLCYILTVLYGTAIMGFTRGQLAKLMQIEFLVIHSFPFMAIVAMGKPKNKSGKIMQWCVFWGLLSVYIYLAFKMGFASVLIFLGLTLATYLGFLLNLTKPNAFAQLLARWIASFVAFMIFGLSTRMPENVSIWHETKAVLYFGMLYFASLGFLELSGLYQSSWLARLIKKIKKG